MSIAERLKKLEGGIEEFGREELLPFIIGLWDDVPAAAKKEVAHALVNGVVEHIRAHGPNDDAANAKLGPKLLADVQAAINAKIDGSPDSPVGGGI